MFQSKLFTKTLKEAPKDEQSVNAQMLERAGFVFKNSAGVYSFLPLGWMVIKKIEAIIRDEMHAIGGQEIFLPALVERKYLDTTKRWDVDVGFEVRGKRDNKTSFALGWSHEDLLTAIATKFINSYKDLPFAAYQIQTKFRNEARAKSGLLRQREFIMKDLYSFHASQEDFEKYYGTVKDAYFKIFLRCGLEAIYTVAAGGVFTASHTHEFQVISPVGEDMIHVCPKCGYAENDEISINKAGDTCPKCGGKLTTSKSIEVGNIFPLGTKYSEAFNTKFINEKGESQYVIMGSYGMGLGRIMATVVEVHHDEKGMIWPKSIAPFDFHLLVLDAQSPEVMKAAMDLYHSLQSSNFSVLFDDRSVTAGIKFADCDLIGLPTRLIVSSKTLAAGSLEIKARTDKTPQLRKIESFLIAPKIL